MSFQGKFYKACRMIARCYTGAYQVLEREEMCEPTVYICRHHNAKGPVLSLAHLPVPVHTWVYYVFCDRKRCYRHCVDYTFTQRFRWSRRKAKLVAGVISPFFVRLVNSSGAIAVYRNTTQIIGTFRESMEVLARGESLLIFPDVDYAAAAAETGRLYDGFLILEHLYYKRTGKHVRFVPMHISCSRRLIALGDSVCFSDAEGYPAEKKEILDQLHVQLNALSTQYGE